PHTGQRCRGRHGGSGVASGTAWSCWQNAPKRRSRMKARLIIRATVSLADGSPDPRRGDPLEDTLLNAFRGAVKNALRAAEQQGLVHSDAALVSVAIDTVGLARRAGGQRRPLEVFRLWDDHTWDTDFIHVPAQTPEDRLQEVAERVVLARMKAGAPVYV